MFTICCILRCKCNVSKIRTLLYEENKHRWGGVVFDPLLILYVCPLTQKLSIYNFNDRFICTHFRRDFVPLLLADTLQVIKVSRLTFGNSNLQLPPPIFYGIEVWRLARPLHDLNELLLDPLICCLGRVFGSLSCWNTHPRPIFNALAGFNALALTVHGPVFVPLMRCSCRVPLAEKHPQSTMFPPPCLRWEWCPWGQKQHSSSSKHSELIWSQRAWFRSHLTTTLSPSSPLNHLMYIGKLHSSLNMCFLEQGDLAGAAPFKRVLLISAPYLCKRHKGARNITDW